MNATARAARFLRALPEPTAVALCDAVRAAVDREPVGGPGIRALLPGMLWRLDAHGCRLAFSVLDGAPFIVTAQALENEPVRRRRRSRHWKETTSC